MQKVVNTKILKNNTFHQFRHSTTFGVAFHHPSGLTEDILVLLLDYSYKSNCEEQKHNPCTGQSRAQALLHTFVLSLTGKFPFLVENLKQYFQVFPFKLCIRVFPVYPKKEGYCFSAQPKFRCGLYGPSPISFKFPPPLSLYRIHTSTINLNFFLHPSFSWTSHWGQVTLILFEIDRILLICKAWVC